MLRGRTFVVLVEREIGRRRRDGREHGGQDDVLEEAREQGRRCGRVDMSRSLIDRTRRLMGAGILASQLKVRLRTMYLGPNVWRRGVDERTVDQRRCHRVGTLGSLNVGLSKDRRE